jgi:glutamate-1-semialdehyde aminotransferase
VTSAFHQLHERAERVLPGGVTAAARANAALGHPFYVERAEGPYVGAAEQVLVAPFNDPAA